MKWACQTCSWLNTSLETCGFWQVKVWEWGLVTSSVQHLLPTPQGKGVTNGTWQVDPARSNTKMQMEGITTLIMAGWYKGRWSCHFTGLSHKLDNGSSEDNWVTWSSWLGLGTPGKKIEKKARLDTIWPISQRERAKGREGTEPSHGILSKRPGLSIHPWHVFSAMAEGGRRETQLATQLAWGCRFAHGLSSSQGDFQVGKSYLTFLRSEIGCFSGGIEDQQQSPASQPSPLGLWRAVWKSYRWRIPLVCATASFGPAKVDVMFGSQVRFLSLPPP